MAEITKKRTGEVLRKLFGLLVAQPDGIQARDVLKALAASVTMTPYESGIYESTGDRRFEKIVRFATVDCVKAGWMLKNKGIWVVTPEGISALNSLTDPEAFYKEAVRLYNVWKSNQSQLSSTIGPASTSIEEMEPAKETSVTFEQAEEQAWAEIEQHVISMNPYDLQDLVSDLLKAMGYHVGWVSPPGKDGGVDIVAFNDPLGTKPPRIKVQVKRVINRVTTESLRSFISLIGNDDVGLFVSTGGFTKDAEDLARVQETRKVTLINLEKLVELWIANYSQLADSARRRLPLTPLYFLTPQT